MTAVRKLNALAGAPSLYCLAAPAIFWVAGTASAQTPHPATEPVEAGRAALDGPVNFPWYDAKTDSLRPVQLSPGRTDDATRASKWESGPRQARSGTTFSWGWLGTLFKVLAIILAIVLVGGLIALLIWAFLKAESPLALKAGQSDDDEDLEAEAERIERLPFPMERPQTDLLGEARRQYEAGNYAEAVIYFFSFQLVQLDKHHWIHLSKGKTNRQYLRELREQADLREMLAGTMVAFEDVFFGQHPLSRDRFERVWRRLEDFQTHVQQPSA